MAQVSRNPLDPKVKKEITDTLWWTLARLSEQPKVEEFCRDLLSRTETTMLSKRLAIALMLSKGYSYPTICRNLKVSSATVAKIQEALQRGGVGFQLAFKHLEKKQATKTFFEILEDLTTVGGLLPARVGPQRRKWLREHLSLQ